MHTVQVNTVHFYLQYSCIRGLSDLDKFFVQHR